MGNARDTGGRRNEPRSGGDSRKSGSSAGESTRGRAAESAMSITEIRIKLTDDPRNKLKAYCSVTIDDALVIN